MRPRAVIGSAVAVWALALSVSARADRAPSIESSPQPPADAQAAPANADCLACHDDPSAARADGRSVAIKPAVMEASIHGPLACVDCHADLAKTTDFPHPEKLARVDCAACHDDAAAKYRTSAHAQARATGKDVAATCANCHGAHDILPSKDPQSRTHNLNTAATCSKCHGNAEIIAKGGIPRDVTKDFADSIHGRALARSGLIVAPACDDCHGAHDIRRPKDPQSSVALSNVPATCGKCHEGIQHQFEAGVHGARLAKGSDGGPACQTCHTAHSIQRGESHGWQLSVIGQCGTCHADRMATFRDTFHGQVTNLGFRSVAGCADCHGAHEILPASDPRSPISPGRLVQTCGKCHEDANANFVKYDPHANKHDRARNPALYYASRAMTVLLAGVFGFFGLHSSLWFAREWRLRRNRPASAARPVARSAPPPSPGEDPRR